MWRPSQSGDDFIQALPNLPKATVLLDVHMPGRSGMETLKALDPRATRRRSSSFPVRAISQWLSRGEGRRVRLH
jgi:FixJ family two-component response regulator